MRLNTFTPANTLGYGIHSVNYLKSLAKIGFDITWTPIGGVQCNDEEFFNLIHKDFYTDAPSLMLFHETHMNQFYSSKFRIGFPVFEGSVIDELSKKLLNQLDYIFVTSKWAKETLIKNNINKNIFVIGEGVNPNIFKIKDEKYLNINKFTFITVGKHETRKNTDLIIESFIETFRNKDVALIAHTFNPFTQKYSSLNPMQYGFSQEDETEQYYKFSYSDCDIYFTKPMMNKDLSTLYSSANIGIFTSRAEGWNLPLCEALACGLPCISCNNTAMTEYLPGLKEFQNDLIIEDFKEEIAVDNTWFFGNKGVWYSITKEQLNEKLLLAYKNNYNKESISNYIRTNFTWDKAAEKTKEVFNELTRSV